MGMLPSAVSSNLADADAEQRTERTSRSRSAERFCCFSLMVSRDVLSPQHSRAQHPSFFISSICSGESKLFCITVLCLLELCIL